MSKGVNKVIVVGRIGNDVELKTFPNNGCICTLSIATTEIWKDRNTHEQKEHTEWHRVILNNRLAEIASQYLEKGSQVYIEGKLKTRKWQNKMGMDQYTTEIKAHEMQMLDSTRATHNTEPYTIANNGINNTQAAQSVYKHQPIKNNQFPEAQENDSLDDIPF
jgi:single-strand DNA-binding protein